LILNHSVVAGILVRALVLLMAVLLFTALWLVLAVRSFCKKKEAVK
jgi:hypothetical protein